MGHVRLGTLPNTSPWRRVVGLIAEAADVAVVAGAATEAAQEGLAKARNDEGLAFGFWLLTQTVLAARQDDFGDALRNAGLSVPAQPSVFDLVGAFSDAVDARLRKTEGRTDLGEMAQLAAVESLTTLLGQRSTNLYGTTSVEVKRAAHELSTETGFGVLAHDFFARFTRRFLAYHLGRELSNHVGGNGRFPTPGEHDAFVKELDAHCRQTALIVKDYAAEWFSKHHHQGGITLRKVRNFTGYAVKKLRSELERRGVPGGQ